VRFRPCFSWFKIPFFGIIILLSVCLSFQVSAQTLKKAGLGFGRKNCKINCFTQDLQGNIWIGTNQGLFCLNGLTHSLFDVSKGMGSNQITSVCISADQTVWAGHNNGKVSLVKNQVVTAFRQKDSSDHNPVSTILEDIHHNIWLATYGNGIYVVKKSGISRLHSDNGLNDNFIYTLYEHPDGSVWAGTDAGICVIREDKKELEQRFNTLSMKDGLFDNIVKKICKGPEGRVYVAMQDSGICYFDPSLKTFRKHLSFRNWNFGVVNDMLPDVTGFCWVASQKEGLLKLSLSDKVYTRPVYINTHQNLTNKNIHCLFMDFEHNIWLGTNSEAFFYSPGHIELLSKKDGLPSNKIYAFCLDHKGNRWISSDSGLTKIAYDAMGKPVIRQYFHQKFPSPVQIMSIYEDQEKFLWLGTFGNGVFRLDPESGKSTSYTSKNGLANDNVLSIAQDASGNLWFASLGGGASKGRLINGKLVCTHFTTADGLGNNYVYSVFADSQNRLWFATDGGGISCFRNQKFTTYNKGVIGSNVVYSICEDQNRNIWFSNAETGVYRYDGKKFELFGAKTGIRDLSPSILVRGKNNDIVVAHNGGIEVLRKVGNKNIQAIPFSFPESEEEFEPSLNATFRQDNGDVWIGTDQGLIRFSSQKEITDDVAPKISITGIKLNLQEHSLVGTHEFSHSANHLVFDFMGIYHKNPMHVRYRFHLDGFEKDWSPETESRFVSYPNLPPGKYTFQVKASNGAGNWSKPASYSFEILPPLWQRWWFLLPSLSLLGFLVYATIKYRLRRIEHEKTMLEKVVKERTTEILDQKQIIELKNKSITDSINYAKRIQEAILPTHEVVASLIPDSFIFYSPKDIVSGDFYFITDAESIEGEKSVVIACVDCTGHGIPGGFMSMIGYSLLSQIIREKQITEPAEILNQLDVAIRAALRQEDTSLGFSGQRDGMDISICCIVPNKSAVRFAGAHRPLYRVKKDEPEVEEWKGNKFSVGGLRASQDLEAQFTSHTFEYLKGDCVYLFSDGYADQFGGSDKKKFMTRRLRELLIEIHDQPMELQGQSLATEMDQWKGQLDQIDDMLVIGIRL